MPPVSLAESCHGVRSNETGLEEEGMNTRQLLGLLGSALLFIGVFLPLVSIPLLGSLNYFQNGRGDGVFVLLLATGSAILTLIQRYRSDQSLLRDGEVQSSNV